MLFTLWDDQPYSATCDVDFLGFGVSGEEAIQNAFRALRNISVADDGLALHSDSVRVDPIRDATQYRGVRVTLLGELAGARRQILADIRFGDSVTPKPKRIEYPNLLKFPAPLLRVYPRETAVTKKYQALVHLAIVSVTGKTTTECYELTSNVHRCFHYSLEKHKYH